MRWNIGHYRNVFLNLETNMGIYQVALRTPKTSPKKLTLTVFEMQQLPDIEKKFQKRIILPKYGNNIMVEEKYV